MENENIVKEAALSVAKETAKDVYADTVQPTAKNVGGFFGTLSGFFNHVVMYPLKKLNIKYEQKAIAFEKEMEKKSGTYWTFSKCCDMYCISGKWVCALCTAAYVMYAYINLLGALCNR